MGLEARREKREGGENSLLDTVSIGRIGTGQRRRKGVRKWNECLMGVSSREGRNEAFRAAR